MEDSYRLVKLCKGKVNDGLDFKRIGEKLLRKWEKVGC